jgi:hypothetical protein
VKQTNGVGVGVFVLVFVGVIVIVGLTVGVIVIVGVMVGVGVLGTHSPENIGLSQVMIGKSKSIHIH